MTAHERTGWRDRAISERHRLYGGDCPMVDIDFPVIEYDQRRIVALIEYKLWGKPIDLGEASHEALRNLAHDIDVPFVIAAYEPVAWNYYVVPASDNAWARLDGRPWTLTERQYVRWLHRVRGRRAPADVLLKLKNATLPDTIERPRVFGWRVAA